MKFLAVFTALLAVACASNTWNLQMLSDATSSPHTDPALLPYLEAALNEMMEALWAGQTIAPVTVTIPAPTEVASMGINELSEALQNPETDPALLPALEQALNDLMDAMWAGQPVSPVTVTAPAMEIHYYTLNELSAALQDPTTNPQLLPYLEHALNELMTALFDGQQVSFTVISVPAGLTPIVPAENDVPVVPVVVPEAPVSPVETPAPASPASPSSPLVQIIVNINQQQEQAPVAPAPAIVGEIAADPVIVADPVQVVDNIAADPVQVVDVAPVSPVQVVDVAPVSPVQVVDVAPVSPVQVVDVVPSVPLTPLVPAQPIVVDPVQVVDAAPAPIESVIVAQPIFT